MSEDKPWDGKTERRRRDLYQQELLTKMTAISVELDKVVRFVEGNGYPAQGAIVRLDRLEQENKARKEEGDARKRHINWMWSSIGGLALTRVWDFLTKSR